MFSSFPGAYAPPAARNVDRDLLGWLLTLVIVLAGLATYQVVQVHQLRTQVEEVGFNVGPSSDPYDDTELCTVLGALAAKEKVNVGALFSDPDARGACASSAIDGAQR